MGAVTTLVVHVHPLEESYTTALLDAASDGLDQAGATSAVVRLAQGEGIDPAVLAATTHLIVVAPTWWGAMPAQLLAWIQETLGPWVDGSRSPASSPLATVQRVSVVTSYGSSRLVNAVQGEPGRHLWLRVVVPLCAPGAELDWIALYRLDRLDLAARQAFLDQVRSRMTEVATMVASTAST
jgi:putative NADPH-quinone reductase